MIFHEIYGRYYQAVAVMLALAVEGKLTQKTMNEIVGKVAFEESMLAIVPAIRQQEWLLIDQDYETPILQKPTMPLTTLQKRWLKTICMDPRIKLFQVPTEGLEDVEPLFDIADVVYFDKYLDGDSYENPWYIHNFHLMMQAIREHRKVEILYQNNRSKVRTRIISPLQMEYSDKEDKFRVQALGSRGWETINMERIVECELLEETFSTDLQWPVRPEATLVFELTDERNVLERAMMKFAHYKKEVEKIGDNTYRVQIAYDKEDQTDVLIQVLTFGAYINVIGPSSIKKELSERLTRQLAMMNW